MIITLPAQERSFVGRRPINLNKDVPQIIKLLELTFGHRLDGNGQRQFYSNMGWNQPAFLLRSHPMSGRLALGYVWEEDGRIVGNATLLPTKSIGRYLVVNVAVHPDFRRHGIARLLMEALMEMFNKRNGRQMILQVVKDNTAALNLYQSMNFNTLGSMTMWRVTPSCLRDIDWAAGGKTKPDIQKLPRQAWQSAYQLDSAALPPELNWPEPIPPDVYKSGFWRQLENLLNGRHTESWAVMDKNSRLAGLASIWSEVGRPHQITLRVHPQEKGYWERPLLAKIIQRTRYLPQRNIRLEHPDNDELVNQLLREANFRPQRTLVHMRFNTG